MLLQVEQVRLRLLRVNFVFIISYRPFHSPVMLSLSYIYVLTGHPDKDHLYSQRLPHCTPTHLCSHFSSHRHRMSKCPNFYISNFQFIHNDVQVYFVNAQILLKQIGALLAFCIDSLVSSAGAPPSTLLLPSMSSLAVAMSPGSLSIIYHNDTFL